MPAPYALTTWASDSINSLTWSGESIYVLAGWVSETY